LDEAISFGLLGRRNHLLSCGLWIPVGDVGCDRTLEQIHLLTHQGDAAPQIVQVEVVDGLAIDADATFTQGIKPEQKFHQGAFA